MSALTVLLLAMSWPVIGVLSAFYLNYLETAPGDDFTVNDMFDKAHLGLVAGWILVILVVADTLQDHNFGQVVIRRKPLPKGTA